MVKVLVSQINPIIGDLEGNTKKIIANLEYGKGQEADIVLFPELTICGYPPQDLVLHRSFIDAMELKLKEIAAASQGIMAFVGLVRHNVSHGEKGLLNSAAVVSDGKILGYYDKWLLPTYDVFNERRYFEPGEHIRLWECKGKKIGCIICEDIWQHAGYVGDTRYKRDPVIEMAALKPDLLLNLSASPYQFQKPDVRIEVCSKAAKTLKCPVILCCQVGSNDQLLFDGYSVYVNAQGELCQLGKGFQEDQMMIDLEAAAPRTPFRYDPLSDLYHALVMGVRDYFQKLGFQKACLGLSGGIDSALVAAIAVDALGPHNVLGIMMPSHHSSTGSISDSERLAHNLKIKTEKISIEPLFNLYTNTLNPHFKGKPEDVTEENLQARIRGTLLMAFSNKFGYVVLSTGNKSEMAVGYCTLYGDMCGGLSVIGDVTKTKVYELCRWLNRDQERIPPAIIEKEPSAELRAGQKDSDSLPPYEVLDRVLQAYVEDYLPAAQIAQIHDIPLDTIKDLIHKIHISEYKRRQSAPILRVSKKSFSVGRHYPIVQGWA